MFQRFTHFRFLLALRTCLWVVLALCLGSIWASLFVPSLHKKGSTQLARFVYTYDKSGLRIGSSDVFGSTTTPVVWNHDSLMRLTQETKSGVAQSWGYDEVSNRTSQVAGGNTVAAAFDIRDRLTSLGTTTYTWDVAGRLASHNVSGVGTTRLGWQDDDRLRRVDLPTGASIDYTYDAQGLMATRTDASGTERYTWDGTLPYGQMIATTNATGALKAREVWGTDHLAEIRNDTILWLLTDGLGHVRAITDSVGKIIGREDFDAWGNRTLDSGRTVRFGYRGEWSDAPTGLVYLRARWMDPQTGRFTSEDPFAGASGDPVSLHRFLYANSGPVNGYDPTGKFTLAEFAVSSVILNCATVSFSLTTKLTGERMVKWKGQTVQFSIDGIKKYKKGGAYWDFHPTPWQPFDIGGGPEMVITVGVYKADNLKAGRKSGGAFVGFNYGYGYGASLMGMAITFGDFEVETPSVLGDSPYLIMGPTASLSATVVPGVGKQASLVSMGFGIGFNTGWTLGADVSVGANAGYNIPIPGLMSQAEGLISELRGLK